MPQKSAICVKVRAVFSISHTAVALGISGRVMACHFLGAARRGTRPLAAAIDRTAERAARAAGDMTTRPGVGQGVTRYDRPVGQERPPWQQTTTTAPPRKRARLEKLVLDPLGIEELRDYIGELRAEIARVEADIARKQATAAPPTRSSSGRSGGVLPGKRSRPAAGRKRKGAGPAPSFRRNPERVRPPWRSPTASLAIAVGDGGAADGDPARLQRLRHDALQADMQQAVLQVGALDHDVVGEHEPALERAAGDAAIQHLTPSAPRRRRGRRSPACCPSP